MLNTFSNVTKEASLKKRLLPCAIFLIMSCLLFYFAEKNGYTPAKMATALFFLCGIILLLIPYTGKKIYYLLSLIAAAVNYVFLNTLLILFYYILFTPLALIIRISIKLSISRKMDLEKTTLWSDHRDISDLKQYFKQY